MCDLWEENRHKRFSRLLCLLFISSVPLWGQQPLHFTVVSSLMLEGNSIVGGSFTPLHGVINIVRGTSLNGQIEDGDEGYTIGGDNTTIICAHRNEFGCFVPAGSNSDTFDVFVGFLVSAPRTVTISALLYRSAHHHFRTRSIRAFRRIRHSTKTWPSSA